MEREQIYRNIISIMIKNFSIIIVQEKATTQTKVRVLDRISGTFGIPWYWWDAWRGRIRPRPAVRPGQHQPASTPNRDQCYCYCYQSRGQIHESPRLKQYFFMMNWNYCLCEKCWHNLYNNLLYRIGQDLLNIQYYVDMGFRKNIKNWKFPKIIQMGALNALRKNAGGSL